MDSIPYQIGSPHALIEELSRRNAERSKTTGQLAPAHQPLRAYSIALSREAGACAVEVARAVGEKLKWPVFDRELVENIADDLGLRASLLEAVDEKLTSWVQETVEGFGGGAAVKGPAYAKHLMTTLLSLAVHGECVIVGRGSAQILPAATTLRVRLISPASDRAAVISQRLGISLEKARSQAKEIDKERAQFVERYFHADSTELHNYDVILNVARLGVEGTAKTIIGALDELRAHAIAAAGSR